jgi:hypothetical protein
MLGKKLFVIVFQCCPSASGADSKYFGSRHRNGQLMRVDFAHQQTI